MALHIERAPGFGSGGCSVEKILNSIDGTGEVSCRLLRHGQGSRAGGHFKRRFRCPQLRRESLPLRNRVKITCSSNPLPAMPSPAVGSGTPPSLSDHVLDCVSCYLLEKGKKLMGPNSSSHYRDPLEWLPPKLHEQLFSRESFAIMLVREGLVFGTLGVMFFQVNNLCRGLYSVLSATRRAPILTDGPEYKNSVFHAATAPLRLLITVWASTRMLRIISVSAQLQQYFGTDMFVKARGIGIVGSGTWFLFRWKQHLIDDLILKHKTDKPRIIAFDKLVSLVLYFLAATCIADIVGFALGSLLAVGGISGLALGLAAKEVVSNFFGAAVIFLTRPFVIGERIKAGAVSGQVQDIGFLQTKILGFDGVPLLVPNQSFINQVITNFSRAKSKLLEASFYLHDPDIFLVDKITEQVVEYLKSHPQVETERASPMCYLKDMGQHWGPEISIMCTVNYGGGRSFFSVRQEIMVQVARIIVDVLGDQAPYYRNSMTNLMWELRMHLLCAGQLGILPGNA